MEKYAENDSLRKENKLLREKFLALCEGLEVGNSEFLMEESPEFIKEFGEKMTRLIKRRIGI